MTSKHDMGTTISEKHYMVNITWFDQFKELKKYLRNVYDGNLATSFFFFFLLGGLFGTVGNVCH